MGINWWIGAGGFILGCAVTSLVLIKWVMPRVAVGIMEDFIKEGVLKRGY